MITVVYPSQVLKDNDSTDASDSRESSSEHETERKIEKRGASKRGRPEKRETKPPKQSVIVHSSSSGASSDSSSESDSESSSSSSSSSSESSSSSSDSSDSSDSGFYCIACYNNSFSIAKFCVECKQMSVTFRINFCRKTRMT